MALLQERSTTGSGTSLALAFTSNNTAGSLLIACVGNGDGGDTLTSVTDSNTNTWAQATFLNNSGVHSAIWYAMNCNAGANTVTANFSASEFASNLVIAEESGMLTSGALDVVNTGSGFGTAISTGNITTTVADTVVYGCVVGSAAGDTYTVGGSFVERFDTAHNRSFQVQRQVLTATGTLNSTQTKSGSNANWSACIAAFKVTLVAIALEQEGYRWRNDDGSETTATWKAAQDTTVSLAPGDAARIRFVVNATQNPVSQTFRLQYRKVGDASWRNVDTFE